jgi:hypothetical protein
MITLRQMAEGYIKNVEGYITGKETALAEENEKIIQLKKHVIECQAVIDALDDSDTNTLGPQEMVTDETQS